MSRNPNKFEGQSRTFESGSAAFVGNNGEDFAIQYINAEGEVTQFMLSPEAAFFTAQAILSQIGDDVG